MVTTFDDDVPPEGPEPELQAATSRPAATRTPVILRRLIVVALH
jgi:hypothetical protein